MGVSQPSRRHGMDNLVVRLVDPQAGRQGLPVATEWLLQLVVVLSLTAAAPDRDMSR